jgi:xanthine/uracil/vitamin C permease (AzgA family)
MEDTKMQPSSNVFSWLFKSRKVLIAALGVVQTLVLHYLDIPPAVWASIDALLVAVITGITAEDVAEKLNKK